MANQHNNFSTPADTPPKKLKGPGTMPTHVSQKDRPRVQLFLPANMPAEQQAKDLPKRLTLEADTIRFSAPYGHQQSRVLVFTNDSTSPSAFKVQCSQATFYCVKPNKGVLDVNPSMTVAFTLKELFTNAEMAKALPGSHKFQVQAVKWPDMFSFWDRQTWEEEKEKEYQTYAINVEHINEHVANIHTNA